METLPLNTTAEFIQIQKPKNSQIVMDKFIECCVKLDASIFEPYMQEEEMFDNKSKSQFLTELKELFENKAKKAKNAIKVSITNEICRRCKSGHRVHNFELREGENNVPFNEFGFRIETDNGVLKDIQRCNFYKEHHHDWFRMDPRKKAKLESSKEYLNHVELCKQAMLEIMLEGEKVVLNYDKFWQWKVKYANLYAESVKEYYDMIDDVEKFQSFYGSFNMFFESVQYSAIAKQAVEEMNILVATDSLTEDNLLLWLVKYEEIGMYKLWYFFPSQFHTPFKNGLFTIKSSGFENLYLTEADFGDLTNFKFLFQSNYWELLDKYCKLIGEEPVHTFKENITENVDGTLKAVLSRFRQLSSKG